MNPAAKPRAFVALRHRGYRGFFLSFAGAMMADSIEHVISYWVIFEKFQSPALGGFAIVSHWVPFLAFSMYAGAMADRMDPRRMIQLGMALYMGVSLAWGALILTDTLEMWHAMALLTIHGIAGVLWGPPSMVLLHHVVPTEDLQSAVRLNATSRQLGFIAGPAIGGVILLIFGPAYGLMVNALLYVPTILWLRRAPYSPEQAGARAPLTFGGLKSALRSIAGHRTLMSMILLAGGASMFVGTAYQAQMPGFAHALGHQDADLSYSMLLGADAVGALTAGILLESRGWLAPNPRTAMVLAMLWCGALIAFAASPMYVLSLGLLFVAGFLELSFNSMAQTLVQLQAPKDIRGSVIGLFTTASLGLRSVSGLTVGVMGAAVGIHVSLAGSALVLLLISVVLYLRARRA